MNIDEILDRANYLLWHFPYEISKYGKKQQFRRKPHLRACFIENRKVFFDFLHKKYRGLNKRDKARRYEVILYLRDILTNEKPVFYGNTFIYKTKKFGKKFVVIIKEVQRRKRKELYLYSLYPE